MWGLYQSGAGIKKEKGEGSDKIDLFIDLSMKRMKADLKNNTHEFE